MKILYIIIYILLASIVFSQNVVFEMKILNPCDNSIKTFDLYRLKKDSLEFHPNYQTGKCYLTTGDYSLSYVMEDIIDKNKNYHFKEAGYYCDTLLKKRINKCLLPANSLKIVGYCCCDVICNGCFTDYYRNGNRRFSGKFENGIPIGKLYYYNKEGSLIKIEKYNRKGKLKKIIKIN